MKPGFLGSRKESVFAGGPGREIRAQRNVGNTFWSADAMNWNGRNVASSNTPNEIDFGLLP